MSDVSRPVMTGGCQCGAVRYGLMTAPRRASICHCRMCQRASGSYMMPLANVLLANFVVTRGTLAIYRSSPVAERGYCRDCGAPLTFRYLDKDGISVTIPSLDAPDLVAPTSAYGTESISPHFADLLNLPGHTVDSLMPDDWRDSIAAEGISDGRRPVPPAETNGG